MYNAEALLRRPASLKAALRFFLLVLAASTWPRATRPQAAGLPHRQVAVTFDDLPAAASNVMTGAEITNMTAKLLAILQQQKIPAV